jgi:hypothetical protein
MSTVYKITKQLCGKTTPQPASTKDTNGNPISTEHEQPKRWIQYFHDVLNCPGPGEPACPDPPEEDLDINIETPTIEEIRYAIKTLRNGKSPGINYIHAKMLKADIATSSEILQKLFNNIWNKEIIPNDWTKGLIVKLPKREIYKYVTTGEE